MIVQANSDYATMDLVLAMDLKGGLVVHGRKGQRESYRPLTWGLSASAEPGPYLGQIHPRFLYIADLDRITGSGSHDAEIESCCRSVERCYVDRGIKSPGDYLPGVVNIIGTETAGEDLSVYHGGVLSLDLMKGLVIPGNRDPISMLHEAAMLPFDGCLILNLGAVGTGEGLPAPTLLDDLRRSYDRTLLFGGGVSGEDDLDLLLRKGFDGAVVATAVHHGRIPVEAVRKGIWS
jgi:phosphoribosylformimino-5-aminoimidazole carboxamide ribotide isomerase